MICICTVVKTCDSRQEGSVRWHPLNIPGEDRTVEDSSESCQQRCVNTSGCYGISFWVDGGCHLAGEFATLRPGVWKVDIETYGCSIQGIRYFAYLCITVPVNLTFNPPSFFGGTKIVLYR